MSVISSPDTNRYVCAATHFLCVIIIVVIVVVVIVVVLVSLLILLWVIFVAVVQKEKKLGKLALPRGDSPQTQEVKSHYDEVHAALQSENQSWGGGTRPPPSRAR